ncbi:MAG: hypothetical protein IPN14_11825 [Bacteroidetes bacterium]|nr:hypothetical protein [Bacteroidota bacterium]
MKHLYRFIILFMLLSCSQATSNTIVEIKESNIKSVFNKPLNLVFLWTTWCGVSKSILKETYTKLQIDSNQYNIILICGNNDLIVVDKYLSSLNISLKRYCIDNSSNIFPIIDRKNIKEFIKQKFNNTENISVDGNFGESVTLLIDSSLNILNSNMPQDTTNIRSEIAKFK